MGSDLKAVIKAVPKRSWNRGEIIFLSFVINIFAIALPIFIIQVYDRVIPLGSTGSLFVLAGGLLIVIIFDLLLKQARTHIITWNGAQFDHLSRMTAVDRILRCPLETFEKLSPSAFLEKVNALSDVKDFYSTQIATLIVDLPFALLFLVLIGLLGGPLVLVPLILLVVFALSALIVGRRLRTAVTKRISQDDRRYNFLFEALKGIHTIKAMNLKPLMVRRFERLQETTAMSVRDVAQESALAQGLSSLFSQLNMISVISFGAVMVVNGSLTLGGLAACMLLSGRALGPLQAAMGIWVNYQTVQASASNARDVMSLPDETADKNPPIPALTGELELRDVCFAYGGGTPFINNVNLKLKAGEVISIEGANSSGRTTLFLLMLGMLRPQSGKILLDGRDIFEYDLRSVRREVSMISHNAPLYSGNLIDNLTGYQKGDIIYSALDLAEEMGLDEEISKLPAGYDTQVGGSTVDQVAGGTRQRIAIVRALVDDPKLILFDEGNLSLDAKSTGLLRDHLEKKKGKSTMILVSPSKEITALADRHFIMENGKLSPKPKSNPAPKTRRKPTPKAKG